MTLPTAAEIDPVIAATWPAERVWDIGAITLRDIGGGQRALAATAPERPTSQDLTRAEDAMRHRGEALFRIQHGQDDLDTMLDDCGYIKRDPTNILVMATNALAKEPLPPVSAFSIWPPLAIIDELWEQSGTGADRRANMARVRGPKIALLGRASDQPGGVGFAAAHGNFAMIHAVWVSPHLRRQKIAQNMMISAAKWAQDIGANWLTTLCTAENIEANNLYTSLGMKTVGQYHYRAKSLDNESHQRNNT